MTAAEMASGRYVCVAPLALLEYGGCQHSPHITISRDGVWVAGRELFTSAHRDCLAAWTAAAERSKR